MVRLGTPLQDIQGIGPRVLSRFRNLGIGTAADLIKHFPSRYEDFSVISPIGEISPGQQVTVTGTVGRVDLRRSWRKKIAIVDARISDETGTIKAVWFNQPYIKNALVLGKRFNFSGKVSTYGGEAVLSNPMYEGCQAEGETRHTARLVPIYPETRGMTSKGVRFIMKPVLANLEEIPEYLPEEILEKYNLPEINEAIRQIHFPQTLEEAETSRKRFAFEELFLLSLWNLERKVRMAKEKAAGIKNDVEAIRKLINELPFTMTVSQKKCLLEILQDMEKNRPMNRLLQGDVGSGKTVVAMLAAINAARSGQQAAIMAPTEVLARQHYRTLTKLFPRTKVAAALLTSGPNGKIFWEEDLESEIKKAEIKKQIKEGKVGIAIGTHALIQKDVEFKQLGMAVIDEQHRFGVEQRAALTEAGKQRPHFLSMSATPIPRTLTLTIFGDLDLSVINELPKGRKKIETEIVPPTERDKAYKFIRSEVKKGRQVFVICPRIEKAEEDEAAMSRQEFMKLELKSVKEEFKKLTETVFPDLKVAMLHGKMKAAEKNKTMQEFADGETDILVTTSVVEVGVDVPNATIMMVEGAERFGLSQLYQFRGRVGRGEHQSYCLLFTDSEAAKTAQRLKAIKTAKNGFELAEQDLKMRGPGQFLGKRQTGLPDTAMRSLTNLAVINEAREAAVSLIKEDVSLKKYPQLKQRVKDFIKKVHEE